MRIALSACSWATYVVLFWCMWWLRPEHIGLVGIREVVLTILWMAGHVRTSVLYVKCMYSRGPSTVRGCISVWYACVAVLTGRRYLLPYSIRFVMAYADCDFFKKISRSPVWSVDGTQLSHNSRCRDESAFVGGEDCARAMCERGTCVWC